MTRRLPLLFSTAALLIAVFGVIATSHAASSRSLVSTTSFITVVGPTVAASNPNTNAAAYCPKGWIATGGGVDISSGNLVVALSSPIVGANDASHLGPGLHRAASGWVGNVHNLNPGIGYPFNVAVICSK